MKKVLGWAFMVCAVASYAHAGGSGGVCEKPNVLVVLDYSGSMNQANKWNQAVNAVTQLATTFERSMQLGLMLFPQGGECRVEYQQAVVSSCSPDNARGIQNELSRVGSPPRGNNTPIGRALNQASTYFNQLQDVGRRSIIVLVTDGQETCRGNPVQAAQNAFNNDYPVIVIGFGQGVDGNTLNRIADVGGTGQAYLVNDGQALFDALDQIADRAQVELCDALDNDCDGKIDEDIGEQPCETECGTGRQRCVMGRFSICEGGDIPEENCNGIDDDCDGEIDEDVIVPCVTVSGQPGFRECVNGMLSDDCSPEDPSREEVCDGIDNDMDGKVDEVPEEPCNYDCHEGRRLCIQGAYVCTAEPVSEETCNGFDDDCDGKIDEGDLCAESSVCAEDGLCLEPCRAGECPNEYFCDPEDNLCHPAPCMPECSPSQRCRNQRCFDLCQITDDCGDGFVCRNRICVPGQSMDPAVIDPNPSSGGSMQPGAGPQNMNPNGQNGNNGNDTMIISEPGNGFMPTAPNGGSMRASMANANGTVLGRRNEPASGCNCDLAPNPIPSKSFLILLAGLFAWRIRLRRHR